MKDIDHLRQFVALARELNFGRAADQLGIAQPALSRTIKRLETELKLDLFDRSRRQVQLTPAGAVYLVEIEQALRQLSFAEERVRRIAIERPPLRLGFVASAIFDLVPEALRSFRGRCPQTRVLIQEHTPQQQVVGLLDGSLDLALMHELPDLADGIETRTILDSPLFAAIPADWQLARNTSITLADLADQAMIVTEEHYSPVLHSRVVAACNLAGFTPKVAQEAGSMSTAIGLVASGVGITFAHALVIRNETPHIRFVPIADAPEALRVKFTLAWLRAQTSDGLPDLVEELAAAAERLARQKQNSQTAGTAAL